MALTGGGGVWECGRKDYGQLGHGDRTGKHLFARVGPGHFGEPASSWRPAGCPYFMMPGDLVKRVVEVCRWGEAKSFGEGVLRLMGAERSCRRSRHKQPYSDQPRFRWTLNRRTATAYSGFPLRLCPWKSWPRPFSHVILQDRVSVVAERREESGRSRRVTETWHGQAAASNSFESPEPPPIIWVAHVSSGHLCEYLASDLVFADSSSLDTLPSKPAPQPASKKAQKIVVGSKVELTSDYTSYSDAASGPLKPGKIGVVTAAYCYYIYTHSHTHTHTHTSSLSLIHTLTHTADTYTYTHTHS